MISKKNLRIILIIAIIGLTITYWLRSRQYTIPTQVETPPRTTLPSVMPTPKVIGDETIAAPPLKKGSRPFYGELPEGIKNIDELPMANKPSKDWKKRLEAHLKRNTGDRLKSAAIEPQESYVIPDAGGGRYVERVIVKVKGSKGEFTTFFAEVDSETGYVLKSWGATIQEKRRHQH